MILDLKRRRNRVFVIGFGIKYIISSMIPALLVYGLFAIVFTLITRKNVKFYQKDKYQIIKEYILVVYLITILKITGLWFVNYNISWFREGITNLTVGIPFVEASSKMIFLNTILFVPYGALMVICFRKITYLKMLILTIVLSLNIEIQQLFVGRLFEIDDILANTFGAMFGYFLTRGIFDWEKREKVRMQIGMICFFAILYVTSVCTITAKTNNRIDETFSEMELNGGVERIEKISVIQNKVLGVFGRSCYDEIYDRLKINVSNMASAYSEEKREGDVLNMLLGTGRKYISVSYEEIQNFSFSNNPDLRMKNVKDIFYDLKNGDLYYRTDNNDTYYKWKFMGDWFEDDEILQSLILF